MGAASLRSALKVHVATLDNSVLSGVAYTLADSAPGLPIALTLSHFVAGRVATFHTS